MVCWLFSVPGFIFSFYLLVIPYAMMAVLSPLEAIVSTEFYKAAAVVFSWTALIKMTTAWVHDEPISKLLVVFGTVTGIACAAFFLEFILLVAPCGLLGIYLFFITCSKSRLLENSSTSNIEILTSIIKGKQSDGGMHCLLP